MKKNYSTIVLIFLMLMGTLILFNKKEASEFEMRKLKKYPELTKENIFHIFELVQGLLVGRKGEKRSLSFTFKAHTKADKKCID